MKVWRQAEAHFKRIFFLKYHREGGGAPRERNEMESPAATTENALEENEPTANDSNNELPFEDNDTVTLKKRMTS
jgi:hypothetical protein